MLDSTIDSKNTYEPWSYTPNYQYSKKLLKSKKTVFKVIRYSILGVAFVFIAETIKELVKIPLKLLGNLFGLYKYSLFKDPKKDNRSCDDIIKNLKSIEHLSNTPILKKALYISSYILGCAIITYISYPYVLKYGLKIYSSIKDQF